jgi:pyruvate-ferredoxin/flavodoxin oxidoreductase
MARKMKTMDGNNAAAWVSYPFTEVAAIYPITPSSVMAEVTDSWSAQGRKNLFGQEVTVAEMQSEAGAAGAVHGSLAAGALTTTYTASQGLLLMIPNMYKIAGELLPSVIHVSARCVSSHALNIFGDHSDVYACRQTGYAMLASSDAQEVMDLGMVAHLATLKSRVPFLHFFDGFRTSHEVSKIEVWSDEDVKELADLDLVQKFRDNALNPNHPVLRGTAQNPDIFFQAREACNKYYDAVPAIVEEYMNIVNAKIGTNYKLFEYYGAADAEQIIIAMGSVNDTIEETIDYLNAKGQKTGLIKVRLYRPFSKEHLIAALPKTVKKISVLDRTKEPGSLGEPLYLDVVASLKGTEFADVPVYRGRYGLGSKDVIPADIKAVFDNNNKPEFTLSITDDVTGLSLPRTEKLSTAPEGTTACKFWGLGSDGTVGANKNSIKIIGDHTDMFAQAYFAYDSKKSGGVTVSHLRFGNSPIKSTYLIQHADFVACHKQSYINQYDMVSDVKPGGTFLLNTIWTEEELDANLPAHVKKYIADNDVNFYIINGVELGKKTGMGTRINTILQSAFFYLANIIPFEDAVKYMKDAATASYSKKGQDIVDKNHNAIDVGYKEVHKVTVPDSWKNATGKFEESKITNDNKFLEYFVNTIQKPSNSQIGDTIPVSAFENKDFQIADGTFPQGSAAFEKRGIAVDVPEWISENCIQCNQCSYVCPHACIRPAVGKDIPGAIPTKPDVNGLSYRITTSVLDCTGCGVCANICPAKNKALVMKPIETQYEQQEIFDKYAYSDVPTEIFDKFKETTVKGSQFKQPLLEFSGACAGCGETPYAKLITQLFGDRMYIANATGCSSIWGGSSPSTPYTVNKEGKGPAWANSLFEDNAEYGFGMKLATEYRAKIGQQDCTPSHWIFGGDGWAYDIGFGGLDHVIASGKNVNIFVFDTEVYSNTGGQSSKSTPIGAVAQFAADGKKTPKKDLFAIAQSYGYVYVAKIAMGADMNQTIKAITEAESYDGPSLIIAYAPCINHGIKIGMSRQMEEQKKAVKCGYWELKRFIPEQGLVIDSKEPDKSLYDEFLKGEVRYNKYIAGK